MISLNLATIINMLECQGNEKKVKKKKVEKNERKRKKN